MSDDGNDLLVKMEIPNLIKFADKFAGIEVHLPVAGKLVKLNYAQDQFIDILRRLQQKDVQEIYVKESDSKRLIEHIEASMGSHTFYDPKTTQDQRVEAVNAAMDLVKGVINQLGVDPETVKLLKVINARAMYLLSESPSVFAFIKQFKKNCSEEFLRSILTNYVLSLMIDKFPWASDQVKEKTALASIMCDMTLTKCDFEELNSWEKKGGKLSEKLKRHPLEIAENLKRNRVLIPSETITIIEQHHERPDGTGFPIGITANRFNQLSTIFIIGQQFAEKIHETGYDYGKRGSIIQDLRTKYGSFKMFDKAIDALILVVN